MRLDDFQALVDAWGGDPNRWPDDRRDAAEALLEQSEQARAVLAEAAQLDRLLASAADVAVSTALRQRIGALPGQVSQERKATSTGGRWGLGGLLPRFAGAALALAVGFYVGTLNLDPIVSPFESTEAQTIDVADYVFGEQLPDGVEL